MITLKLTLDTRRVKQDGTCPLVFRMTLNSQVRDIPLKIYILESEWNRKTASFRTTKLTDLYQSTIEERKLQIMSKAIEFERNSDGAILIQELKKYIAGESNNEWTFKQLWEDEIKHLESVKRYGNIDSSERFKCPE